MEQLIYQRQRYGCGIASVKMALAYYAYRQGIKNAPNVEEPFLSEPMSLQEIISFASRYGMTLKGYRAPFLIAPAGSLMLLRGDEGSHMAFFIGKRGKRYLLLDPESGRLSLDEEGLSCIYAGCYLKVESFLDVSTSFTPQSQSHFSFHSRWLLFALALASFLPNLFLLFGVFVLGKENTPLYLPIGLFVLSLLSSALSRFIALSKMKRFDRVFQERGKGIPSSICFDAFTVFQTYKSLYFTVYPSLCSYVATLFVSGILLSLLDPFLGVAMVLGLAFMTLAYYLVKQKTLQIRSNLIVWERRLHFEHEMDKSSILKRITSFSHQYGLILLGLELLAIVLAVSFVTLILLLENHLDAYSFVMYGVGLYYCFQIANKMYRLNEGKEKQKKEKGYLDCYFESFEVK